MLQVQNFRLHLSKFLALTELAPDNSASLLTACRIPEHPRMLKMCGGGGRNRTGVQVQLLFSVIVISLDQVRVKQFLVTKLVCI